VSKCDRRVHPSQPQTKQPVLHKPISEPVSLSFRYIKEGADYCLSQCSQDEVRQYKKCLRLLTSQSWQEVMKSGGRPGNKVGLGYTVYDDWALSGAQRPPNLSPELRISGVRASDVARLFGVYIQGIYYILWFDPKHKIVKG
jgi:hypothetical protein